MRLRNITLAGIILLVLAFTIGMADATENATGNETPTVSAIGSPTETLTVTATATSTATAEAADDEESGEGLIGPGNALYGLAIAFGNIDEVFTFNASEKLGKQVANARHRLAEVRATLKKNDTEAANKALAAYEAKIKDVNDSISKLPDKATGLVNAQKMILKHQLILVNLSITHTNNSGLQRAYNNSKDIQIRFASKMGQKLDSNIMKGNRTASKDDQVAVSAKEEKPEKGKGERRN
ncbi:hypothetical protein KKE78_04805 [Patescibacteria group bacterium]|nr:hypothetical protein [Patescibacteria group bacterium]